MMKKSWDYKMTGVLIFGLILCFFVPASFAQGNIRIGQIEVHPGISYGLSVNDNIYAEHQNEEDDILHTFTPSIDLVYDRGNGTFFNAGYNVDVVVYQDNDKNNYETHRPYASLGFRSPMGLYLTAGDYFVYTEDPYGSYNQYGLGRKVERYNNKGTVTVGYEFNRYAIEGLYTSYVEQYVDWVDQWQDRIDNIFGVSFFYDLTGKTAIFGQYRRTMAEYDEQNDGIDTDHDNFLDWTSGNSQDYDLNDFFIGARFQPGGKLVGVIKIGYGSQTFENDYDKDGFAYEDDSDIIAEILVQYMITDRTTASLNLQRAYLGAPDGDAASYLDTRFNIGVMQELANRLSAQVYFEWDNNDYRHEYGNKPSKQFDIYEFMARLNYDIQDWLKAGAQYKFTSKQASNSYYNSSEFDRNVFTIDISALF